MECGEARLENGAQDVSDLWRLQQTFGSLPVPPLSTSLELYTAANSCKQVQVNQLAEAILDQHDSLTASSLQIYALWHLS